MGRFANTNSCTLWRKKRDVVFHATKDLDWFGIRMARLCSKIQKTTFRIAVEKGFLYSFGQDGGQQ